MDTGTEFLRTAHNLFTQYKLLAEKAIGQLNPDQLLIAENPDSNSIATVIKHLHGNMISRWTDFLATDGEKEWRKRDEEFEPTIESKPSIMQQWEEGWQCLFAAIDPLKPEDLGRIVTIRQEAHTVLEAINRQLAHYCYHVGQIVYAAKSLKQGPWNSLSIPRKINQG